MESHSSWKKKQYPGAGFNMVLGSWFLAFLGVLIVGISIYVGLEKSVLLKQTSSYTGVLGIVNGEAAVMLFLLGATVGALGLYSLRRIKVRDRKRTWRA